MWWQIMVGWFDDRQIGVARADSFPTEWKKTPRVGDRKLITFVKKTARY